MQRTSTPYTPPFTHATLIINPQARSAAAQEWLSPTLAALRETYLVETIEATSKWDMMSLVKAKTADPYRLVIIAGGDGSLNTALQARPHGPLAVLPTGTANDLARALHLPPKPTEAARKLLAGRLHRCDELTVNGRPFCTVGGIGVGAAVVEAVENVRARRGTVASLAAVLGPRVYHLAAALLIAARPFQQFRVEIQMTAPGDSPPRALTLLTSTLLVANHSTLAGSLRVSPSSTMNDGVFEICVFKATNRLSLLWTLGKLLLGLPSTGIDIYSATAATVSLSHPATFFGDGDVLERGENFSLAITQSALQFFA